MSIDDMIQTVNINDDKKMAIYEHAIQKNNQNNIIHTNLCKIMAQTFFGYLKLNSNDFIS